MKIIHTADIHLGSKLESSLTKEKRMDLLMSIRSSFNNLVLYARNNGVKAILLCGDIFDSDRPFLKDRKFFLDLIRRNEDLTFYYLKGNHDSLDTKEYENLKNLKLFGSSWKSYDIEDVTISSIEIDETNKQSLYSTLNLRKDRFNIVMLHGSINGNHKDPNYIDLANLSNKNINYLALGHIHKPEEGNKYGIEYAYPGILQGRSFDEIGNHGFYLLDIEDKVLTKKFIPLNDRAIILKEINITDAKNEYDVVEQIKTKIKKDDKNLYRIVLKGKIDEDANLDIFEIETALKNYFYYVNIVDKLELKIDLDKYKNDIGIKGVFIREVMNDPTLKDSEKAEIVRAGISALSGNSL